MNGHDIVQLALPSPEQLRELPVEQLPEMIGQLETLKAQLWARLATTRTSAPGPETDTFVSVEEASTMLKMSPGWVYKNSRKLPFVRRVGPRTLRCSTAGIRRYLDRRHP